MPVEQMMTVMTDPNIVYLVAVLGLWFSVTAVYVPGTVLVEKLAFVGIAGAAILLFQMPTNWLAVMALIVGVLGFIIIPFLKTEIAPLAIVGLALQGFGGYFLFYDRPVSPLLIGFTLLIQFAYHTYVLMPMLRQIRERAAQPVDRDSQLVGMQGRVTKALDPIGTVQVNGELWTALSVEADVTIEPGETVVVIGREGLQLTVESLKRKRERMNGLYEETIS